MKYIVHGSGIKMIVQIKLTLKHNSKNNAWSGAEEAGWNVAIRFKMLLQNKFHCWHHTHNNIIYYVAILKMEDIDKWLK